MHAVRDDFGAAISTGFVEANPTMHYPFATQVPLPHLFPFSEFPKDRHEFSTPLKILPLLLFADQESAFGTESFPRGGSACFELFLESPLLAPLRCRNGSSLPTPAQHQRKSPGGAHSLIRSCAGKE
jgi:hypothetical protein